MPGAVAPFTISLQVPDTCSSYTYKTVVLNLLFACIYFTYASWGLCDGAVTVTLCRCNVSFSWMQTGLFFSQWSSQLTKFSMFQVLRFLLDFLQPFIPSAVWEEFAMVWHWHEATQSSWHISKQCLCVDVVSVLSNILAVYRNFCQNAITFCLLNSKATPLQTNMLTGLKTLTITEAILL